MKNLFIGVDFSKEKVDVAIVFADRRVNQQVQNYKTCLKNSRFGVEKFNFSLGLSFNFFCIDIILLSIWFSNDSFLEIYCLVSLLLLFV